MTTLVADAWGISASTTAADPGPGSMRLNNTSLTAATRLYIDDRSGTGTDRSSALADLVFGDIIRLEYEGNWRQYVVNATITDHTGWFEIPIAHSVSSTPPLDDDRGRDLSVVMIRADEPAVFSSRYEPPSLSELYDRCGRDLRDPTHLTISLGTLGDFINDGIAELNQVKPNELRAEITDLAGLEGLPFTLIWKVELVDASGYGQQVIPPNDDHVLWQNGWTYFGANLALAQSTVRALDVGFTEATILLRVYGYTDRNPLVTSQDVFDGDLEDEMLVRRYVKTLGFQALMADRNLFQQWQIQSNNTDVSPTQLTNMAQVAESEWSRVKRRAYKIRLAAAGS